MNKVQEQALENYVSIQLANAEYIPTALYNALDTQDCIMVEDVLELLRIGAYIVPDEMVLSVNDIDVILEYGRDVDLDLTLGFGSVLESYVMSELGAILGLDLIELI